MDLRSIINNEGADTAASQQKTPKTPSQTIPAPQNIGHEYGSHAQPSPSRPPSQDYSATYPTTPYQAPYASHHHPPTPIQAPPPNDRRSQSAVYGLQSPYAQTPTSGLGQGQYPFPTHQTPQPPSPAQHHQYPPPFQQRESYPTGGGSQPPLQPPNSFTAGPPPVPETSPVNTYSSAPNPYLQRSQPLIQGQQPSYPQQIQENPGAGPYMQQSQSSQHQRQPSQPGTPLGPPLQRHSSGGFTQPSSPYQQRSTSSGPFPQYQQQSPAQQPPGSAGRASSSASMYDSRRPSRSDTNKSQSEREQSLSVSPKTRLPSRALSLVDQEMEESRNGPVKRKAEDELEEQTNGKKLQTNGHHPALSKTESPKPPVKRRIRYTEPPIWARSFITGKAKNLAVRSHKASGTPIFQAPTSAARHLTPETNGNSPMVAATPAVPAAPPGSRPLADLPDESILGEWDKSITGVKPAEPLIKAVADWLFQVVVVRPDLGELQSRGVVIELEAKLGQLIDKDTRQRFYLPVRSECVVASTERVTFKSSMSEFQHSSLNRFLNAQVAATHPDNPVAIAKRVKINYEHRKETDKFYELPPSYRSMLPAAIQSILNPRHTIKVRVTYHKGTGEVLAKIIKTRIADLDIYNPDSPLDCRISANFEMRYEGDVEELIALSADYARIPDRNKDRLSYTQSHYQIDLTQVITNPGTDGTKAEKEHELEIEVSTDAIREQGGRAMRGEPNEYPTLVEGLINNVRVLAREVPPQ